MSDMEWQPIETVPIGERVLVAILYLDGWEQFVDSMDADGEWEITDGEATHWMPLPEPPPDA